MILICRNGKPVFPENAGNEFIYSSCSSQIGEGEGLGLNLNFGFDKGGISNEDYILAFSTALLAIQVSQNNQYDLMLLSTQITFHRNSTPI